MGYYIDLETISIDEYREKLKSAYLPPSRRILRERTEERFGYFKEIGIKNVKELIQLLKKKDEFDELQKIDCLSGDYLTILLRELKSTLPRPNRIKEFPGISAITSEALEKIGIKNTVKLFPRIINSMARKELAEITGLNKSEILELTKLTDLSRIKWVGVTFARILYDIGIDTVEKVSFAKPEELHQMINHYIKETDIYRGQIGLNDLKILIQAAGEVPDDIEY
jgi:hypothetical protein